MILSEHDLDINNRNSGQRGEGAGFYIKDKVTYKRRLDIINLANTVEQLWMEVWGTNKKQFLLYGYILPAKSKRLN